MQHPISTIDIVVAHCCIAMIQTEKGFRNWDIIGSWLRNVSDESPTKVFWLRAGVFFNQWQRSCLCVYNSWAESSATWMKWATLDDARAYVSNDVSTFIRTSKEVAARRSVPNHCKSCSAFDTHKCQRVACLCKTKDEGNIAALSQIRTLTGRSLLDLFPLALNWVSGMTFIRWARRTWTKVYRWQK